MGSVNVETQTVQGVSPVGNFLGRMMIFINSYLDQAGEAQEFINCVNRVALLQKL
jgi:hypothetical protein